MEIQKAEIPSLDAIEIKAFVPAKDLELSLRFYRDLGFEAEVLSENMAYLWVGRCSFLLQRFDVKEHAENFMMHILVQDVASWWQRVVSERLVERYGVRAWPPEDRSWGIRDFALNDPSGVLWRIGQEIKE